MLQGKFKLGGQSLYAGSEISLRKGRELVEEGLDDGWVEENHDDLECEPEGGISVKREAPCINSQERHQPGNKTIACPLEDVQENSEERGADCESDQPTLYEIGDEQTRGGLVKAVFFFNNKRVVYREGDGWDR
jgi:hypothetical protein